MAVWGEHPLCPYPDPQVGLKTLAHRDGDTYVINGTKSAFTINPDQAFCLCPQG